jgi:hypothetical protein
MILYGIEESRIDFRRWPMKTATDLPRSCADLIRYQVHDDKHPTIRALFEC